MPSLSRNLEQAMQRAIKLATERRQEYATLEHLLWALIDDADAGEVMRACGVDLATLKTGLTKYIDEDLATLAVEDGGEAKPTTGFQRVVQRAVLHVQNSGRDEVTGANVLVALFSEREAHAVYFLQEQNMSRLDAVNYMGHGIAKCPSFDARKERAPTAPPTKITYFDALRALLERWCDQRRFDALAFVLPAYEATNETTDAWGDLYKGLLSARALGQDTFDSADWQLLNELISGTERLIYFRS